MTQLATRTSARADYISMGPERSVAKLAKAWAKRGIFLKRRTAQLWCSKYGWVREAEEHDAQVAGEVSRKAIEAGAAATWDGVKAVGHAAEKGLAKLVASIDGITIEDATGAKAMADSVLSLLKYVDERVGAKPAADDGTVAAKRLDGAKADIINLLEARTRLDGAA